MAKLSVVILGNATSAKAALAEAGVAADSFGGKAARLGKLAGTALAGGLVVAAGASVDLATKFQSSMELIHTQAGVSQKAIKGLSDGVLSLAGPVATAPQELSVGLFHLASQGLRGKQALDALRVAAEGAKVGQANLEDVTNALGAAMASHIKGVENLHQAMGALNATVGAGDMHMQDLADAMGTGLAANARLAGVSLKDVSAALAVFGDNNIRGAKAGTALGSALRLMSAPSKTAASALASVGIGATDLAAKMAGPGGLQSAIALLKDKMDAAGLSAIQQNQLLTQAFGGKQSTGVKLLIDEFGRFKTKEEEVAAGANKFGDAWKSTTETASFKFDQFKASMEALGIKLGTVLLPGVTKAVDALNTLIAWFESPRVSGAIKNFIDGAKQAMQPLVDWVRTNWPEIERIIETTVKDAWAVVSTTLALFKAGWREFGGTIKTIVQNDFAAIKAVIEGVVRVIKGVVEIIKGIAHGNWALAWKGIKDVVGGTFGAIGAILKNLGQNFAAIMQQIGKMLGQAFKIGLMATLSLVKAAINVVFIDPINAVIRAIDAIHLPAIGFSIFGHHIGFGGWGGFGIPQIPQLAQGGIVTGPTLAMIGERGPEAVIPLNKGGMGPTINVGPVIVNGSADADFARMLSRELAVQLKGGRTPQFAQAVKAL